jgi:hypothetical protein
VDICSWWNKWNHLPLVYQWSSDANTGNFSSPYQVSADDLYIGRTSANNLTYAGKMFELRKSNQIYSADWYKTNYYAMSSPAGFNIVLDMSTPAGLTSGAYCIPITIDHTKVPTSDVTNMQVLIRGQYPWMATIANGGFGANASGYDIRYYSDSSCTSLIPFERVYWTAATGDSAWRVLSPPSRIRSTQLSMSPLGTPHSHRTRRTSLAPGPHRGSVSTISALRPRSYLPVREQTASR